MKPLSKTGLSNRYLSFHNKPSFIHNKPLCFIGFDGFQDDLVRAVHVRSSRTHFSPIPTITQFANRIQSASGKSTNIELAPLITKMGGNGPILCQALLNLGYHTTLAGTIGDHTPEELFRPLTDRCQRVFCLGKSGHSDAIEFEDGKIILGKLSPILHLTAEKIIESIGEEPLKEVLQQCALFASVNWTMLNCMTALWKHIFLHIAPQLSGNRRWMFVDLADPAKRSDEDLREGLNSLRDFSPAFRIVLGLNESESQRVASLTHSSTSISLHTHIKPQQAAQMAQTICNDWNFEQVVIHTTRFAASASKSSKHLQEGLYCKKPLFSTGAGDNFNAGYCSGLIDGLSLEESLLLAVAASGFYVRQGKSPSAFELAAFLSDWDNHSIS